MLKDNVFSYWYEIVLLAKQSNSTIALAESCTGGGIGSAITSIPGSSEVFLGGIIAYADIVKTTLLRVPNDILSTKGAVSFETCDAMLEGVRKLFSPSFAIATTGIAGPGGGSPQKPVGTVFIGISTEDENLLFHCLFSGERQHIREKTIDFVGQLLWSLLSAKKIPPSAPFVIEIKRKKHSEEV